MGCISSKQAVKAAASPGFEYSTAVTDNGVILEPSSRNPSGLLEYEHKGDEKPENRSHDLKKSRKESSIGRGSFSFRLGFSYRHVEAEQVAAGWPSWLSNAAGEAIHGWVPLRADSFEKLEKIGQGTYSSVFQARHVETGKMVALKKVRFDNFQAESIRFMAREIMILRRLDHPNIMTLEGLITSRMSNSIYLVFEYMEHDLAGLVSSPDIKFSEVQVKCYMRQLLSAIEHCHLRGIMHRDIKASNILVNNHGILKLGDFGLANFLISRNKQPLTSRVVTLWYRPPELLMGSTNYGVSVDLWSVGCVFAELHLKKPILKGRTEVEQLHKIFKLCGSPPDEYWKRTKLPHAAMFKPQHSYESTLREKCKAFPTTAVNLIETFLSIESDKRGTASSALMSEYFRTKPYPCDPSNLPKYPPNKEIDAKNREDARRKKSGARVRAPGVTQKPRRIRKTLEPKYLNKSAQKEDAKDNTPPANRNTTTNPLHIKGKSGVMHSDLLKPQFDTMSETSHAMDPSSQGDSAFTAPVQSTAPSGFAWAKRRKDEIGSAISDGTKSQFSALDTSFVTYTYNQDNKDLPLHKSSRDHHNMQKQRKRYDVSESFDDSDAYPSMEISKGLLHKKTDSDALPSMGYKDGGHIEFSGPLLSQPHRMDELLQRNESHIRRAARRSRFEKDK